jgi:hypothetical protein
LSEMPQQRGRGNTCTVIHDTPVATDRAETLVDPVSMLVIIAILLGLLLIEVGRIMVAANRLVDLQAKALKHAEYQSNRLQEPTSGQPVQDHPRG